MSAAADAPRWTWPRLARFALLVGVTLGVVDACLAPFERRLEGRVFDGALRNAPGIAAADAERRMLLDARPAARREALGLMGSSISYGAGVGADETVAAYLAAEMRREGDRRPVFNLSQAGGGPRDALPVAAALGTHPIRMLLVELQTHTFARGLPYPPDEFGEDELPLLEAGNAAQEAHLAAAGVTLPFPRRVEGFLGGLATRAWRVYRLRGSLWIDDQFQPVFLAWTLRRKAASMGFLPRRFQGQSTNVGKLPWREAYRGQVPSELQRVTIPSTEMSEARYQTLQLLARVARDAGVPMVFYEAPTNLAFQREFHFMTEDDIARMSTLRERVVDRMRRDGMEVIAAPEMPDDGYLDRAHLTPLGARVLAHHIHQSLAARLPRLEVLP